MHDVEISRSGGVQTLRLTRVAKKNALTVAMYNALADALDWRLLGRRARQRLAPGGDRRATTSRSFDGLTACESG